MSKSGSEGRADRSAHAMTDGQRAYEQRRATEAGVSLDAWMARKARAAAAAATATPTPRPKAPRKKSGLLARLLDRAHRPL